VHSTLSANPFVRTFVPSQGTLAVYRWTIEFITHRVVIVTIHAGGVYLQFIVCQLLHNFIRCECFVIFTFCVSPRRRKTYCGHARLCVCVSVCVCVCLSVRGRNPTLLHGPGCNLGSGTDCPLVVHCWADLQSVHGLRCYGNITRILVTSLRPSRDMTTVRTPGGVCARCWPVTGG